MPDACFIYYCINGLKEDIQCVVHLFSPSSIAQVFSLARLQESLLSTDARNTMELNLIALWTKQSVTKCKFVEDEVEGTTVVQVLHNDAEANRSNDNNGTVKQLVSNCFQNHCVALEATMATSVSTVGRLSFRYSQLSVNTHTVWPSIRKASAHRVSNSVDFLCLGLSGWSPPDIDSFGYSLLAN